MAVPPEVLCYGCGRQYAPGIETTSVHTHHAQSQFVEGVMTREKVTTMLESCQRERDRAMLMLWLIGL